MKIEKREDKALVTTPYSADFVKKIKSIGGARWNAKAKAWEIPADSVDTARAFMMEVYGESDISTAAAKVDVKIEAIDCLTGYREAYSIMGRTIAQAWGRDSGARIGDGIDFLKGAPESGGSAKNWTTEIPKGSVFVVHKVPESIAQTFISEEHPDIKAEIVTAPKVDKKALEEERERLLKRLAEIEALLK